MIRTSVVALLSVLILACSLAEEHEVSEAERAAVVAAVEGIIRELAEAVVRGDAADVYDRYLAPDYVFTSAAGRVSTREQMLEELRRGAVEFEDFRFANDVVQVHGEVVVAMGSASGEGVNPGGEQFRGRYRYMAVFVQMDGRWLLTAWQTTAVAGAPLRPSSRSTRSGTAISSGSRNRYWPVFPTSA
ncbi:MAG: nuclear transport factor 2 family protein [Gemmatimonadales bacterium]|jgi:ketosteroid isomerase-like protein